jgi:predicted AAA+ superfamily ATPase
MAHQVANICAVATAEGSDYVPRLVDPLLASLFRELSALVVVGPRACGKTTTASRNAATVIGLDAQAQAAAFVADPDAALRGLREPVLLDEWQEVPEVIGAVRRAVDRDSRAGRFLLTGSVTADLDHGVWPGTGRIVRVPMYPMTLRELRRRTDRPTFLDRIAEGRELDDPAERLDLREYVELAAIGGFPRVALGMSERVRRAWFASYLDDLLTRDAVEAEPSATRSRDPGRLRAYLEAYALNSAGMPEQKTLYDHAGVARDTALAYERLLTRLLVVEQVPAWATNRLKRLVASPKRYIVEPALMMALARVTVDGVLRDGDLLGRVLDTFVAAQLRPEIPVAACEPRLHHLRTQGGRHEVDLLAELGGGRVIGIEIKATATPAVADARHLAWMRDELGDRFVRGVLLHTGPRVISLGDRIVAAPIATIWS